MVTKTFEEIRGFNIAAASFMNRNKGHQNTKLGYAVKRLSEKSVKQVTDKYQQALAELYYENVETVQIDNALTDKDGAIRNAPQGSQRPYMYDKEGLKKVITAEKKFQIELQPKMLEEWDTKTFDIDPYFATELPLDLLPDEKTGFVSFVIDPEKETPVASEPMKDNTPDGEVAA